MISICYPSFCDAATKGQQRLLVVSQPGLDQIQILNVPVRPYILGELKFMKRALLLQRSSIAVRLLLIVSLVQIILI